jgi:hypothetical protein
MNSFLPSAASGQRRRVPERLQSAPILVQGSGRRSRRMAEHRQED